MVSSSFKFLFRKWFLTMKKISFTSIKFAILRCLDFSSIQKRLDWKCPLCLVILFFFPSNSTGILKEIHPRKILANFQPSSSNLLSLDEVLPFLRSNHSKQFLPHSREKKFNALQALRHSIAHAVIHRALSPRFSVNGRGVKPVALRKKKKEAPPREARHDHDSGRGYSIARQLRELSFRVARLSLECAQSSSGGLIACSTCSRVQCRAKADAIERGLNELAGCGMLAILRGT